MIESHNQQMLYSSDEVEGYFDYNSIMTVQGKRIRRLRRTEVSSQKLLLMKYKSPHQLPSSTKKQHRLRQNKSSDIFSPVAHCRSKLTIKYTNYLQNAFYRSKNQIHGDYSTSANCYLPNVSVQNSTSKAQVGDRGVKHKMGDYYFGADAFQNGYSRSKKRSLSRTQSQNNSIQKIESCQELASHQNIKSDYFINMPNIPKQKGKKEIAIKRIANKQQHQQDLKTGSDASNLRSQSKMSLKDKIKNKSSSRLKISSPGSKISRGSLPNNQSMMSHENQMINSAPSQKYSKVSSHQSIHQFYGLPQSQVSKQSAISQQQSPSIKKLSKKNQQSLYSQQSQVSKLSKGSIASNLRKKLRSRLEESQRSRYSKHSQLSKQSIKEGDLGQCASIRQTQKNSLLRLTKKSTDAEEFQKTVQKFQTPKMNKRQTYGLSEARLLKQQTNNTKSTEYSSRYSANMISNTSNPEHKFQVSLSKKQSLQEYTLQQVLKNIQQHDIRLGFLYLFVDNTHECYQTPITFERYDRLCFLMLKKYLFEKNRLFQTLRGENHCLVLTDIEVPKPTLDLYIGKKDIKEKLNSLGQQIGQITKELSDQFSKIQKKYKKDKLIRVEANNNDNFSREIMKLLMEQLTKLYQQLQGDDQDRDQAESNQQRIIEIIQIMFLISQLNGRPVKRFQLLEENWVDFNQYYSDNYERIMETTEYFEALRDY